MERESAITIMEKPVDEVKALEEARKFVRGNRVPAIEGRECVDGRYDKHGIESGMLSRPGADFGYVMALLALSKDGVINLTPQQAVDAVYRVVTENGGRFYTHSDQHAINEGKLSGCGHIMKATLQENSGKYGVNGEDVASALQYLRDKTSHQDVDEPELKGEHEEKGLLIVNSDTHTLDHRDESGMYFVYDKKRDKDFIANLVEKLSIQGLTQENLQAVADKQTTATVEILAEGKPVFEVNFEQELTNVKRIDTIPTLAV